MKKTVRLLAALLALLTVAVCFAACSDTPAAGTEETTVAAAETQSTVTEGEVTTSEADNPYDADGYLKDEIPASLNYNGASVRTLYWSDVENPEFFVEESNGDMVNDAIIARNLAVEERLGVKLEFEGTPGNYNNNSAYLSKVKTADAAGDVYDMYAAYSMTTANVAYNGYAKNLYNYSVIQLDKPWWREGLITEATYNDKLYFCSGDLSTNMLYMMYTFYFNKDMLDAYKLESPYDLVNSNNWTYEKMFEMAATVGTPDSTAPVYGFVTTTDVHLDPFFWGAGLSVIDKDSTGALAIADSFHSEKAEEVAVKTQGFLSQAYCNISSKAFIEGNSMFALDRARLASKNLADATFEYGCVPMPKYSSDQENYVTTLGYPYTLYAISSSSKQPEVVATTLECLASEGYRKITPALFEISMKYRYTSDSQAGMMFDIIRETVNFNIGRIFTTNLDDIPWSLFRRTVNKDTYNSYSTQYKTQSKLLTKRLKTLDETLQALEK